MVLVQVPQAVFAERFYTRENFPDADQTLKARQAEEEEKEAYFTWQDAEGRIHTTPYSREAQSEDSPAGGKPGEAGRVKNRLLDKDWSYALDLNRQEVSGEKAQQADASVLEALGMQPSRGLLSRFDEDCCERLESTHSRPLPRNRGRGVRLDGENPGYDFATGHSLYALIPLPDPSTEPLLGLRLRSFIHKGVLLPTLVFLDQHRQPQRLVTDILFDYEPERWHRHGYLEAWLPMQGPGMESVTHILVLSREQDRQSRSLLSQPGKGHEKAVEHRMDGELELKLISR